MSAGKISTFKIFDKNIRIVSIYTANSIPKIKPATVAVKPIVNPVKKKDLTIDLLLRPSVFSIAIYLVLFLIKIVRPETILKAATIIIKVKIINITFLSTFKALKKDLFKSIQL